MTEPIQNSFQSNDSQLPKKEDGESKVGNENQPEELAGENLKAKTEKLIAEKEEYLAGWKRVKADFINYKKDELKRLEEIARFGNEDLIRDLITVLDSFDLGLLAMEKEGKAVKGMYMIRTQLEDVLKRKGLERVMISVGQPFDPALHESIASVESDLKSGMIVEEVERGYLLHGRMIRPARVKIAK